MSLKQIECLKALSGEQNPEKLRLKFLMFLLNLQYMQRGSMWIRSKRRFTPFYRQGPMDDMVLLTTKEEQRWQRRGHGGLRRRRSLTGGGVSKIGGVAG